MSFMYFIRVITCARGHFVVESLHLRFHGRHMAEKPWCLLKNRTMSSVSKCWQVKLITASIGALTLAPCRLVHPAIIFIIVRLSCPVFTHERDLVIGIDKKEILWNSVFPLNLLSDHQLQSYHQIYWVAKVVNYWVLLLSFCCLGVIMTSDIVTSDRRRGDVPCYTWGGDIFCRLYVLRRYPHHPSRQKQVV